MQVRGVSFNEKTQLLNIMMPNDFSLYDYIHSGLLGASEKLQVAM